MFGLRTAICAEGVLHAFIRTNSFRRRPKSVKNGNFLAVNRCYPRTNRTPELTAAAAANIPRLVVSTLTGRVSVRIARTVYQR